MSIPRSIRRSAFEAAHLLFAAASLGAGAISLDAFAWRRRGMRCMGASILLVTACSVVNADNITSTGWIFTNDGGSSYSAGDHDLVLSTYVTAIAPSDQAVGGGTVSQTFLADAGDTLSFIFGGNYSTDSGASTESIRVSLSGTVLSGYSIFPNPGYDGSWGPTPVSFVFPDTGQYTLTVASEAYCYNNIGEPSVNASASADLTQIEITAVPEPATLTLLGSALLGLGVVYLRRRGAMARRIAHLPTTFSTHLVVFPRVLSLPAGVISVVSSHFPLIAAHCIGGENGTVPFSLTRKSGQSPSLQRIAPEGARK